MLFELGAELTRFQDLPTASHRIVTARRSELTYLAINEVKCCLWPSRITRQHIGFSKMLEINSQLGVLKELGSRTDSLRGYL